ncbi:peptide-methionine (S)-S-oxide reductase MsrA [Luteococcus sp. OSA5]|uniref:peptide-methionine (S)-S-oxide reductase MsrA n=1 Tax=Luteococcus sp. OSA5 TaxID=3401630 RepID=UPI003B42C290
MIFGRAHIQIVDHDQPQLAMPCYHRVFGDPLDRDFPNSEVAYFAMGCFWGAEKLFWETDGVLSTAAGYMGGSNTNPTYEETCTGMTGHAETVRVVFDPRRVSYRDLLAVFLENHDPTQGDRQGNDIGSQYRSAIFTTSPEQETAAREALADFGPKLAAAGFGPITTTVQPAPQWHWAEDYHQQYLDRVPNGYCPVHATGVTCG